MDNEDWKKLMLTLKSLMAVHKPIYVIDDNTERRFDYPPDMQYWMINEFSELWHRIGLRKYCQILPKDMIGKLTSMQIQELALKEFEITFQIGLFEDMIEAFTWMKTNDEIGYERL
ncbi:hypothetical protein [Labilibaculum sp.]|uniref:hypothetical protein n=1 Tax=Labilibaculum sp. TaxID=2060723 RepID=UPI0035659C62